MAIAASLVVAMGSRVGFTLSTQRDPAQPASPSPLDSQLMNHKQGSVAVWLGMNVCNYSLLVAP